MYWPASDGLLLASLSAVCLVFFSESDFDWLLLPAISLAAACKPFSTLPVQSWSLQKNLSYLLHWVHIGICQNKVQALGWLFQQSSQLRISSWLMWQCSLLSPYACHTNIHLYSLNMGAHICEESIDILSNNGVVEVGRHFSVIKLALRQKS